MKIYQLVVFLLFVFFFACDRETSVSVNVEEDWREPYLGTYDCMFVRSHLIWEGDSAFWSTDTSEINRRLTFTKSEIHTDLVVYMPVSLENGPYYSITLHEDQTFRNYRGLFSGRFFAQDSVFLWQMSSSDVGGNLSYTGKKMPD